MTESDAAKPISIRFPRRIWQALQRLARTHRRSFNGEVLWALEEYIKRHAGEEQTEQDSSPHQP